MKNQDNDTYLPFSIFRPLKWPENGRDHHGVPTGLGLKHEHQNIRSLVIGGWTLPFGPTAKLRSGF